MKKTDDRAILRVVIFTGIASVVTQLLTIREFLSRFEGNEVVIALILFNWLLLGGLGSLLGLALWLAPRCSRWSAACSSLLVRLFFLG